MLGTDQASIDQSIFRAETAFLEGVGICRGVGREFPNRVARPANRAYLGTEITAQNGKSGVRVRGDQLVMEKFE